MKIIITPVRFVFIPVIFIIGFSVAVFAQVENVPADHPVYSFLKQMQVEGILKNYDDVILPLSRRQVIDDLLSIDSLEKNLSSIDRDFLMRMEEKFGLNEKAAGPLNLFDNFPGMLCENLISDSEKHIYSYKDSLISFYIDPLIEGKYIYSGSAKNNSSFLDLGGTFHGSYDGWFGFYLQGTNGAAYGNRSVARIDPRIEQSYTFNHTGINFFDETQGYLRLQKGIVSLQLGRERVLWGNGYIDRTILSDNPPLFDFVRFDIAYKKFRYDFLHGWLVQPPVLTYIDSLVGYAKTKPSKYIAISRLGYQANERLSLGISQMIIYSNRPFEAAYLNPFLFWESAQRSMNDLDNSFLTFDGRYLIANGAEVSSSIIFDDINFSYLFKGEWARHNNGNEWQAGLMLTNPVLPEDLTLKLEYLQIRPYTFSHPGVGESLTYTNNGYLLGTNLQPNSVRFSAEIDYRFSGKVNLSLRYSHSIHGNNYYDPNGNLIQNVGGSIYDNFAAAYDSQYAYLLNGNREATDLLNLNFTYEITYGLYFNLVYQFNRDSLEGIINKDNIFWTSLKLNFE